MENERSEVMKRDVYKIGYSRDLYEHLQILPEAVPAGILSKVVAVAVAPLLSEENNYNEADCKN